MLYNVILYYFVHSGIMKIINLMRKSFYMPLTKLHFVSRSLACAVYIYLCREWLPSPPGRPSAPRKTASGCSSSTVSPRRSSAFKWKKANDLLRSQNHPFCAFQRPIVAAKHMRLQAVNRSQHYVRNGSEEDKIIEYTDYRHHHFVVRLPRIYPFCSLCV